MTHWKKPLRGATLAFALIMACGNGFLAPMAGAQPADAQAAIDSHYQDKGGASSPLGAKTGGVYAFGADGAAQDYQGGKIIYSANTGAKVMYGAILDKYLALGGADAVGYPTNDESDAPVAGTARFSEFSAPEGATIEWSPQNGAWLVQGPIRTAWSHLRATDGVLGAPMSDTSVANGVYSQTFRGQGADPVQISWNQAGGFTTIPAEIATQLSGLDVSVPGAPPGQAATAGTAATASSSSSSAWKWWALPLGLVIAALAGGLAAMVTKSSRRSKHSTPGAGTSMPRSGAGVATGAGGMTRSAGAHLATASERARSFTFGGPGGQRA